MTNLQLGMVALIAFLFGGLSAHLLPRVGVRLSTRRARRRVMQFVQPQGFGRPLPPLSETDAEDIGLSIDHVLRQREEACEAKTLRRLRHLGEKAPRCHEMTARVLALLDALCSCAWGCPGGDPVTRHRSRKGPPHAILKSQHI
jgi:hypothetical protein